MSDMTLILDRKGLHVTMESTTIRIEQPGVMPQRVPVNMVGRVIVYGNPTVSCAVWRTLAERGIPALMLPLRGQALPAWAGAGLSASVTSRMAQYRAAGDSEQSLDLARWFVSEKLAGQNRVLTELGLGEMPAAMRDVGTAADRNSLMGEEGAAAAFYFREIAAFLPSEWGFSGRNRRPPRDPVNALLSLSYVLAGAEVRRALFEGGFDPTVGFLHANQRGRDSLMLDVLEPLRPEIDRFVFFLAEEVFEPDDFRFSDQDGCRLLKEGRTAFYNTWARWVERRSEGLRGHAARVVRKLAGRLSVSAENGEEPEDAGEGEK